MKLCRNYTNTFICKILYKLNRSQRYNWIISIIDNIIYTSGPCHQHSNQWQCSIVFTCLRSVSCDQHTALSLNGILVTWYGHIYITYIRLGIILTQYYIKISRQEHHINVFYVLFNSWDSQVSAYTHPFYFSFTVPLKGFKARFTTVLCRLLSGGTYIHATSLFFFCCINPQVTFIEDRN